MIEARTVVADCPWKFGDSLPGGTRGASKNYATMGVDDLCKLALPPIADDALLFFWKVAAMPDEALRVIRAWGFTPKSEIVWVKTSKGSDRHREGEPLAKLHFGMGRFVRASHETCIVASRGQGSRLVTSHSERSVFFAPVGAHSAKPDAFYELVERMTGGPRLDLFARRERRGWTCVGDQLGTRLEVR